MEFAPDIIGWLDGSLFRANWRIVRVFAAEWRKAMLSGERVKSAATLD